MTEDTIFALSTCYGKSALAVIRVTGKNALSLLKHFCIQTEIVPRLATLVRIYDNTDFIDECILIFFPSGNSYTGLDLVELHTHGSAAVISKVLSQLSAIDNYRLAKHGEFTRLALENGKITLEKAEALIDLLDAETDAQHKAATQIYCGELENVHKRIREDLVDIIAECEAYIDFPDDMYNYIESLDSRITELYNFIKNIVDSFSKALVIKNGISVTIVGATNAGKSTLMNLLTRSDTSIISDIAGTTRDVITNKIEILGIPLVLHDTAGIRESNDTIEEIGINKALKTLKSSDLIIYVHDACEKIDEDIISRISSLQNNKAKLICFMNKIDRIKDSKAIKESMINALNKHNLKHQLISEVSLLDNNSYNKITNDLKLLVENFQIPAGNLVVSNLRQQQVIEDCLKYLSSALSHCEVEIKAEDLKSAAASIGELLGRIDSEEILDKLFSSFCIGK